MSKTVSASTTEPKTSELADVNVAVFGATGSIGTATVDVLENLNQVDPERNWRLWAASGHQNLDLLFDLAKRFEQPPDRLILSCVEAARDSSNSRIRSSLGSATTVMEGGDALVAAAEAEEVDVVVAAIVGRAGLESTLAAVQAGKRVALANKETLVVAGPVVSQAAQQSGAELLPVDSEHSAIFQCIQAANSPPKKLILTASGGPFRTWTEEQMASATRESALAHPTWEMGPKITIDSATMMNKALEIIEARWLFGLPADAIEVVVHPQSIIHSMVEFEDGSIVAQMSPPDMKLPIQYALTYPRRLPCTSPPLDRGRSWDLTLEPPDLKRFPALELGFEVAERGGTAGAVLNAANEEAVDLFLNGQIRFTEIAAGCRDVLDAHHFEPNPPLERLLELDGWARKQLQQRFGLD